MLGRLTRRVRKKRGIALVTANFGDVDTIKALPQRPGIDAFYLTDEAGLANAGDNVAKTWSSVTAPEDGSHFAPRLRSRYVKHQIHRLPEAGSSRWLVWADSSFMFKELNFIRDMIAKLEALPPHERLMLVPHPHRQTVMQEIDFVLGLIERGNEYLRIRYGQDDTRQAIEDFRARGFDLQNRLWCGGFWIVENNSIVNRAWDAWWTYTHRYGTQDQYYLPIVLAEFGLRPQVLDVDIFCNRHFEWVEHQKVI